jgi:hypothetical protein
MRIPPDIAAEYQAALDCITTALVEMLYASRGAADRTARAILARLASLEQPIMLDRQKPERKES